MPPRKCRQSSSPKDKHERTTACAQDDREHLAPEERAPAVQVYHRDAVTATPDHCRCEEINATGYAVTTLGNSDTREADPHKAVFEVFQDRAASSQIGRASCRERV